MWRKQPDVKPSPVTDPPAAAVPERPAVPVSAPRSEATRISRGLLIKGEITGREDIYIDGRLEGRIRLMGCRVVVGPNGRVVSDIEGGEVIIEGHVDGNLCAGSRVELRSTAVVQGDIVTQRLAVQDGARFRGRVEMVRAGEAVVVRAAAAGASGEALRSIPVSASE